MFHKDYHQLNDIYNLQIVKESVGLGPQADNENVIPSPTKIQGFKVPQRDCDGESEDCESCDSAMATQDGLEDTEKNDYMSKQLLFRIFKLSAMLHDIIRKGGEVEAWVLSKLTNAHDDLESVFDYKDYEAARSQMEMMGVEENNEEDLYAAIAKGGDSLVNQLRSVLKKESRETLEKVLMETIVLLENKT